MTLSKNTSDAVETVADPLVDAALNEWKHIFRQHDWDKLPDLLADDVTYSNPGDALPLQGKDAITGNLRLSFSIFEDFEYARAFSSEEGHVLEFSGTVGDVAFTGIDIIRFDTAGKITDLVVMIRPVAAIMKLGQEAARRMATANQKDQD